MYEKMVKLDSDVDVRCDFCKRTGRQGYMLMNNTGDLGEGGDTGGVDILCPGCYEFLIGDWIDENGWDSTNVFWKTDFKGLN